MSQVWKYKDIELELDMGDVESQERYEEAFNRMGESEKKLPKTGTYSQMSRAYCQMFYDLYDYIFGEGTGKKLLGEKFNVREVDKCYNAFLTFVKEQIAEINEIRANTLGLDKGK